MEVRGKEGRELLASPIEVSQLYLKSWFPIDFLSIIVIGFDYVIIAQAVNSGNTQSNDTAAEIGSNLRMIRCAL